ncbi:hypothetical protein LIER_32684 [Lithospermum erythrorhizon]|uniref:Uncharacterized protein n=1 Tax=Lithospermum erythrorhizon TaxID=34254 RepID=A0AAV3S0E6_LITER
MALEVFVWVWADDKSLIGLGWGGVNRMASWVLCFLMVVGCGKSHDSLADTKCKIPQKSKEKNGKRRLEGSNREGEAEDIRRRRKT